jgi:hypothetical protein
MPPPSTCADDISNSLGAQSDLFAHSLPLKLFVSHRGRGIKSKIGGPDSTYAHLQAELGERWGGEENSTLREGSLIFRTIITAARDPGLHLDFRAGRRWLAEEIARRQELDDRVTVLNTFANTCTAGVVAAAAGASAVCNVDVSETCLSDGDGNARLNGVEMETLRYDAIIAMRMFAAIELKTDRRARGGANRGRAPSKPPLPSQIPVFFNVRLCEPCCCLCLASVELPLCLQVKRKQSDEP